MIFLFVLAGCVSSGRQINHKHSHPSVAQTFGDYSLINHTNEYSYSVDEKSSYDDNRMAHATYDECQNSVVLCEALILDVPLPVMLQPLSGYTHKNQSFLSYTTTLSKQKLLSFFKKEMESSGWICSAFFDVQAHVCMVYKNNSAACTIILEEKEKGRWKKERKIELSLFIQS